MHYMESQLAGEVSGQIALRARQACPFRTLQPGKTLLDFQKQHVCDRPDWAAKRVLERLPMYYSSLTVCDVLVWHALVTSNSPAKMKSMPRSHCAVSSSPNTAWPRSPYQGTQPESTGLCTGIHCGSIWRASLCHLTSEQNKREHKCSSKYIL